MLDLLVAAVSEHLLMCSTGTYLWLVELSVGFTWVVSSCNTLCRSEIRRERWEHVFVVECRCRSARQPRLLVDAAPLHIAKPKKRAIAWQLFNAAH